MNKSEQETLQFVLGKLAERMVTTRRLKERFNPEVPKQASPEQPGVVFVLGAGCSMQYGLPSFVHLLRHSYDDLQPRGPKRDKAWGLDSLRDRLDPHWRTSKPQELRDLLDWYLNRIHGSQCTGYLRLARMVRNGYVTAIVNMNFDLLLKQALSTTCDPKQYVFSRTFDPKDNVGILNEAVVFTPHGSMQDGQGVPILDLASSDLFDTKDETEAAERLFRQNDIVFLGYSGADAKIAAALTPAKVPTDKEEKDPQDYNQIFVLNVTTPDPRLLRIMVARRSTDLAVTGYAAAFENVMEELDQALEQYWNMPQDFADRLEPGAFCAPKPVFEPPENVWESSLQRSLPYSLHFTAAESRALHQCKKLALDLRSTMSVAEGGRIGIEDHATEIFELCLMLARCTGVGLTAPEKYLLHCAAYLHDLGYFWAHSGSRRYKKSGWLLLSTHGEDTAELLAQHLERYPESLGDIFPEAYHQALEVLRDTVISLCWLHSMAPIPEFPANISVGSRTFACPDSFEVPIEEFKIMVRPALLHAIFSTAEELTQGHPFFPSPHPLESQRTEGSPSKVSRGVPLEDPVLDLYLRLKPTMLTFYFTPGTVVACPVPQEESTSIQNIRVFLATLARCAVKALNTVAGREGGWGLTFKSEIPLPEATCDLTGELPRTLWAALDTHLASQLAVLKRAVSERNSDSQVSIVPAVLDLLAIHTDPLYSRSNDETPFYEPVPSSPGIKRARTILNANPSEAEENLLYRFMSLQYWPRRERSTLEKVFCASFEDIYRPAWRFCADKWLYGIDALVMARASLDFGSSHFRDEVILGLRKLFEDKITWFPSDDPGLEHWRRPEHAERWRHRELWAFGHDGCTVCTSRLLYILATARRILPADVRKTLGSPNRGLDEAIGALLRFMLRRDLKDGAWWGIEEQQRRAEREKEEGKTLRSADYLAWAVKAVAHVLAVDEEIRGLNDADESWLATRCGIDPEDVVRLFRGLWKILGKAGKKDLLGERTEEPHSYILGHVATTYLFLRDLNTKTRARILPSEREWDARVEVIERVVKTFNPRNPAQLSQFFVWPAEVFLARMKVDPQLDKKLVDKLEQCLKSRVWIKNGEGRGSWGYNIDNTQRIVSSLNTFWRLAFRKPDRFESLIDQRSWSGVLTP